MDFFASIFKGIFSSNSADQPANDNEEDSNSQQSDDAIDLDSTESSDGSYEDDADGNENGVGFGLILNGNATTRMIGPSSYISSCSDNSGTLNIGENVSIQRISWNTGSINIGNNSRVGTINDNSGSIHLGENCVVDLVRYNYQNIILGKGTIVTTKRHNYGMITSMEQAAVTRTNANSNTKTASSSSNLLERKAANKAPATDAASGPNQFKRKQDVQHEECSICMEKPRNVAFVPCGHVSCEECSKSLRNCHMCRKQIKNKMQLFF